MTALFYPEDFSAAWHVYKSPATSSKKDALKAWIQTARSRPSDEIMLSCIVSYNAYLARENEKRRMARQSEHPKCHMATWLRQERWDGFMPSGASSKPLSTHPSWNGSRETLERQIRQEDFNGYFALLEFRAGPPPAIICPTQFMADHVARKFQFPLRRAFGESLQVISE